MPPPHTLPKLEGVTNFRELGGIPTRDGRSVKWRRIFRSGHWGSATESDLALMRELRIGRVFDFRSDLDLGHDGHDRLPDGVDHVRLPTSDPAMAGDLRKMIRESGRKALHELFGNGGAERFMTEHAAKLVTDRADVYRNFLLGMAEPDSPPVLFHCSAGKDRAGWAGSCVLLALGVDEHEVVEHYLLSNVYFEAVTQGESQIPAEISELLRPLWGVRIEYVQASIEAALAKHGSIDGYLRDGLGLRDADLERLRANWLE